jgi:type IV pilus assembly protein PilM
MGRKVLGLEISGRELKTVLVNNGARPQLKFCDISSAPYLKSDGLTDDDGEIAGVLLAVKELMNREDMLRKADAVAVCVSDPQTVVRHMTLPALPQKELLAAVEYDLSQSFPGVGKSHSISFKEYARAKNKVSGIASFSPKRSLEAYRKLLEQMDFKCSFIDVVPNADAKAYAAFASAEKKNETALILDIGPSATHYTILEGKRVMQSRQIPEGFRQIRDVTSRKFGISQHEYDALCLTAPDFQNLPTEEFLKLVTAEYASIEEQLRQTIEFYGSDQNAAAAISHVYLTGCGSVFPGLREFFEAELTIPVSQAKTPDGMPVDNAAFAKAFSVIGAAIRED